jgi:hypothetical protein
MTGVLEWLTVARQILEPYAMLVFAASVVAYIVIGA